VHAGAGFTNLYRAHHIRVLHAFTVVRFAKEASESRVDWRSVMRRWAQQLARADYSWKLPSTRHIARGLYLPSLRSEAMGALVVAVDTSGSIDDVMLSQNAVEIRAIADELQPERITVIYADADVLSVETFERGEHFELHPLGGGGTDHRPVFEYIAQMEEQPVGVVCLTDLATYFPEQAPDVEVLWCSPTPGHAPFGEVVVCR